MCGCILKKSKETTISTFFKRSAFYMYWSEYRTNTRKSYFSRVFFTDILYRLFDSVSHVPRNSPKGWQLHNVRKKAEHNLYKEKSSWFMLVFVTYFFSKPILSPLEWLNILFQLYSKLKEIMSFENFASYKICSAFFQTHCITSFHLVSFVSRAQKCSFSK